MNAHPEMVLTEIFKYCDLPISEVPVALRAFSRDSQAGTAYGRANAKEGNRLSLSDQQRNEIAAILQRHPALKEPDVVLSGTLRV
jgi:hypothetical protein